MRIQLAALALLLSGVDSSNSYPPGAPGQQQGPPRPQQQQGPSGQQPQQGGPRPGQGQPREGGPGGAGPGYPQQQYGQRPGPGPGPGPGQGYPQQPQQQQPPQYDQQQPQPYGRAPAPGYAQQQQQPLQQQEHQEGGGFLSRLTSKFKGDNSDAAGKGSAYGYSGQGQGQGQQYQSNTWQGQLAQQQQQLQAVGPARGPMASLEGSGSSSSWQQQQQQRQQQQYEQESGLWDRIKGKVFAGDGADTQQSGPPSFRPNGSRLPSVPPAQQQPPAAYGSGMQGAYPGYPGAGMGMGMGMPLDGAQGGGPMIASGPGKPEVLSIDGSVVFILKPNELARKKAKFKADGPAKLQVLATFDQALTCFQAKDGHSHCLRTTELLEQNQHVMLPDAAKKIRFLRSDFRRRMETEGKTMTPAERSKALEEHLRKVYNVAAMEGGIHMNSIGPAIESQLPSIPLREGINDLVGALAYRGIPLTVFCAGYGNVALEVMRKGAPKIVGPGGAFTPHFRLIANFFRPDNTMTIISMFDSVPLVHEGCKHAGTILEFLKGAQMETSLFTSRPNIVLLGHELSDLGLTSGLQGTEGKITIGFLKMEEEGFLEKLGKFSQAYDAVVLGDGDAGIVNEILYEIAER
ncbi:unnamed protein product [Chrysoparadoxa australica]